MLTLHHLDFSRSTRVLWLLEELGLPYEMVRYSREVGAPAPEALARVHPLGKSPVLEDDGFTLAESSAILRYLDARYGGSRFTPTEPRARAMHDEWLDWVEGSLANALFVPLMAQGELPRRLSALFARQLDGGWVHIAAAVSRWTFIAGNDLTLADMQLVYPLAVASAAGALRQQPAVDAYLQRLLARPALARALAVGGPMA